MCCTWIFVITVCDRATGELCPFWPSQPITAHWGFSDQAQAPGSNEKIGHLFSTVCYEIKTRLDIFCSLRLEKLEKMSRTRERDNIGGTKR
jgi:arsenate reductase